MRLRIHSKAPTRIDLAGGTIDLWPLYLFIQNPITLNLGIQLYAEAELISTPVQADCPSLVTLESLDQKLKIELPWQAVLDGQEVPIPPGLELHYKLLRYFLKEPGTNPQPVTPQNLRLSTTAKSPAGAGLGGSSTLSIAIVGALSTWASGDIKNNFKGINPLNPTVDGQKFIDVVRDIETTVIRVPAGLQDYYGAMYGGLQSLHWGIGTHTREYLSPSLIQELQERILLFYSGKSRNSGINNWTLYKDFIDDKNQVKTKFEKISAATHSLKKALLKRNWDEVGHAIAQEWEVRKTLAPEISTPEIETAFQQAQKLAPVSGKICGAGGGGCFFIYIPGIDAKERSLLKTKIESLFKEQKMQRLEFQGVPRGLEIEILHE